MSSKTEVKICSRFHIKNTSHTLRSPEDVAKIINEILISLIVSAFILLQIPPAMHKSKLYLQSRAVLMIYDDKLNARGAGRRDSS